MTVGAYVPLDDALRIAFTEFRVEWIHRDYGRRNWTRTSYCPR